MKTTFRTLAKMQEEILKDEKLQTEIIADPKHFFEKLNFTKPPIDTPWVFVVVVGIIGVALLISLLFIYFMIKSKVPEENIPEIFGYVVSASIAAITGLLAPSPLQQ